MELGMTGRHSAPETVADVTYDWQIIGFLPAPMGWLILSLDHETGAVTSSPLPGWLVQEIVAYTEWGEPKPNAEQPDRPSLRVIAGAVCADGEVMPAAEIEKGFWRISGPGQMGPTAAEVREEIRDRKALVYATDLVRNRDKQ
jgi:hypothetical protein